MKMFTGKSLKLCFEKKIRDELKFDGIDALKSQIENDVERVRTYFDADSI